MGIWLSEVQRLAVISPKVIAWQFCSLKIMQEIKEKESLLCIVTRFICVWVPVVLGRWCEAPLCFISIQRENQINFSTSFCQGVFYLVFCFVHFGIFVCLQTRERREEPQHIWGIFLKMPKSTYWFLLYLPLFVLHKYVGGINAPFN